jgi:hypothetical protein
MNCIPREHWNSASCTTEIQQWWVFWNIKNSEVNKYDIKNMYSRWGLPDWNIITKDLIKMICFKSDWLNTKKSKGSLSNKY